MLFTINNLKRSGADGGDLNPLCREALDPKSSASANFATSMLFKNAGAFYGYIVLIKDKNDLPSINKT